MLIRKIISGSLLAATLLTACERDSRLLDEQVKTVNVDTTRYGFVKVINAYAPTSPTVVAGTSGPKIQVFANGVLLQRDSLAYNATFPAPSGAYAALQNGPQNFLFLLSRPGTNPPVAGDTVFRATADVRPNRYYSIFLLDSVQRPGALVVEDRFTVPGLNRYQVRFANFVTNPQDRYDVYADSIGMAIATNVGYREISDFIEVPVPRSTENFTVRRAGTTTTVYTLGGFQPTAQRVYTVYARGRTELPPATTSPRPPGITFYTNR